MEHIKLVNAVLKLLFFTLCLVLFNDTDINDGPARTSVQARLFLCSVPVTRRNGGALERFLTLDTRSTCQFHVPQNACPAPIFYGATWAPKSMWTLWTRKIIFPQLEIEPWPPSHPDHGLITIAYVSTGSTWRLDSSVRPGWSGVRIPSGVRASPIFQNVSDRLWFPAWGSVVVKALRY